MGRRRALAFIGIFISLFIVLYTPGQAANPLDATVTINAVAILTVTQEEIDFGSVPGLTSGPQPPVTVNLNAKCNRKPGYTVYVRGQNPYFNSLDGDPQSFPLSRLEFLPSGAASYAAVTTSDQMVYEGARNTTAAGDSFSVLFRLNLSGDEASGTYTNTLTFTIVAK
ncbi:MAG: hypothetical protein GX493_00925 [Firmicutes bacterium]|nr:hypothetical protein [Bacillota bacterium]